jgi:3-hydroxyisobutyrate dehydrogenase-like beta-hydroxyacid dehydrogenase
VSGTLHIGMIGLGNMGAAIAERLTSNHHVDLHVCDINPVTTQRMHTLGARVHNVPREVANVVDTVCFCLPSIREVEDALFGPDGITNGNRVEHYVELSTIGPDAMRGVARRVTEFKISALDAPVSGGPLRALQGTLTVMTAGPPQVYKAVAPVLAAITAQIVMVSEAVGDAQTLKLVNNLLAAANMATSFEALALGVKLGLSPEKIIEVVNKSSGKSTGLDERKAAAILSRSFDVNPTLGRMAIMQKDLLLAFEMAQRVGFPLSAMPSCAGVGRLWQDAVDQGLSSENVAAAIKVIERIAGIEVRGLSTDSA